MSEPVFLGIDPGESGGLCAMFLDGAIIQLSAWKGETEAIEFIEGIGEAGEVQAAIERVGGFVKGNPAPGSAMFKFGNSYGWLRGLLSGMRVPYCTVRPQDWQKGLGLPKSEGQARKRALRDIATQRFPQAKPTLKTADAILIADWLRKETMREVRQSA